MVAPAIGAALVSGAGQLLGGILGSRGQRKANENNLRIAREQMAFQERMSSTAYQRSTKDLEKAGLNRILAIGGPSSTPGGASAVMQNAAAPMAEGVKGATSSALAAATQIQQLRNLKVTESAIRAQVEKTLQETQNASSKDVLMQVPKAISETIMSIAKPVMKGGENLLDEVKEFHKERLKNRKQPTDEHGKYKVGSAKNKSAEKEENFLLRTSPGYRAIKYMQNQRKNKK
jgi:hypothetical protein